jgi:hypothetical protein
MGISEVKSPASSGSRTRTGFGPASNQPMSPGARSNPGRVDQATSDPTTGDQPLRRDEQPEQPEHPHE